MMPERSVKAAIVLKGYSIDSNGGRLVSERREQWGEGEPADALVYVYRLVTCIRTRVILIGMCTRS